MIDAECPVDEEPVIVTLFCHFLKWAGLHHKLKGGLMARSFEDHFASVSKHYAEGRPTYPPELFAWMADQCGDHVLAWDCGAGSGQASIGLAEYFGHVVATDASESQISQSISHPVVEYRVAPAEKSALADVSVDLVVVAQALHWFDRDRFFAEAERVLKPGGLLGVWCYGMPKVDGIEVNAVFRSFYRDEVGIFWPPERQQVETGYCSIDFPFLRLPVPEFEMKVSWRLVQLLDYIRSWSATAGFIKSMGFDPVAGLEEKLQAVWGGAERNRAVKWPLTVIVGRKERCW